MSKQKLDLQPLISVTYVTKEGLRPVILQIQEALNELYARIEKLEDDKE